METQSEKVNKREREPDGKRQRKKERKKEREKTEKGKDDHVGLCGSAWQGALNKQRN
jgi:hypothetical protein